ncbi:MAG TPA: diguanylate cyclase, partial [Clostridia bacterium]|nr:diguanylate cyclase [Clostridia bacterium]
MDKNVVQGHEIAKRKIAQQEIKKLNDELEKKVLEQAYQLEEKNDMLDKSNTLFSTILESSPQVIIFALDSSYCYLAFNNKHKDAIQKIWGKEIKIGMNMLDVIERHEERNKSKANFDRALAGESFTLTEEYGDEMLSRLFWQNYYAPVFSNDGKVIGLTCFILNITDRIQAEASLKRKERLLSESQKIAHIGIYEIDLKTKNWKGSPEINEIFGIDETYSNTLESWVGFIHPDWRTKFFDYYSEVKTEKKRFDYEYKIIRINDGKVCWIHGLGDLQFDNQRNAVRVIGTIQDITKRKEADEEIIYLGYHDKLTGLYNRRFYEEEIKRLDTERNLPMTIVMGDANGLKLINDAFGHAMGDELLKKAAEAIKKGCRADDIIARLGGDEFVIILPKTDALETEKVIKRIKNLSLKEKVGSIDISISFGYETKNNEEEKIQEVFKKAEDYMYKKKLFISPSMRGKTINAIISTLHEKNKREEQHSHRVSALCKRMGEALGLPDKIIEELKSVGLLHDIGKIAIDENILNNSGKLTDDEWKEIKRHPEIGYRILSTVNDMSAMADYVLYHHERWDGKGYPRGLKGEDIPFVSRIIAIADAYD